MGGAAVCTSLGEMVGILMIGNVLSLKLMGTLWVVGAVVFLSSMNGLRGEQEFIGTTFTNRLPGTGATWIEGPDNTILMSLGHDGKTYIASSGNEGRSWQVVSVAEVPSKDVSGCGYFTRLSETTLLLRGTLREAKKLYSCWIRSDDNGRTWSQAAPILPHRPGLYVSPAPIRVMSDGRWAATYYYEKERCAAYVVWSSDQGQTWSEPITFPTPADGNRGSTEVDVCEVGPNNFVAAIRADEGHDGSWDGFYLSWSTDGLDWSVPVALGDRGRQPSFYRVGKLWALSYRLYDHALGIQHGAIRFSRDGKEWSPPMIIEQGVQNEPFIVQVRGRIIAFNYGYPDYTRLSRHDITAKVKRLLRYVGTIN